MKLVKRSRASSKHWTMAAEGGRLGRSQSGLIHQLISLRSKMGRLRQIQGRHQAYHRCQNGPDPKHHPELMSKPQSQQPSAPPWCDGTRRGGNPRAPSAAVGSGGDWDNIEKSHLLSAYPNHREL